jgi:hypothetical protein
MRLTTVAVLVICFGGCCNAQKHVSTSPLQVVTDIHNAPGTPSYLYNDSAHALIKIQSGRSFNDVTHLGFSVIRTLNKEYAVVRISEGDVKHLTKVIEQIKPVNHLWKLSDNLLNDDFKKVNHYLVKSSYPERLKNSLQEYALKIESRGDLLMISGDISPALSAILLNDEVTYVGLESFSPKEEGRVLDLYHGPNKINKIHHEYPELDGSGIVVSVKERQFNPMDLDLLGRSIPSSLAGADTSNHATEMATIIAGAGNSFITGKGVASHSKITSSSFANLFPDTESDFTTLNSYLQNHAYGTVVENFYGALANAYDLSANQDPKILHVFSSGNSGASLAASGIYVNAPGYSNLTGNSKMAKNALIVGSVDTTGNAISFSSRGPANDGRIKPELVAYSTAGTSNSAALVTGVAALLQQAYKSKTGLYPDAALLKAILINAADDAGPPGIDFITGFGNMNAYRSLNTLLENKYFESSISEGEIKSFDIVVPVNARNLKATLVWNDPAAPVNSSSTLINNLDLELMSSGGIVRPWILDSSPNQNSLGAPPTRGVDNINNIEQVTQETPSPQTYQVRVSGISLASSSQKFFIAYQWEVGDTFTWNYPTASDNFPYNGETGTYFYWRSTVEDENGHLEVSIDKGLTWNRIASNLNLQRGYYRWENPLLINASAVARMIVGSNNYVTDEFTISQSLIPSVGFNCADSVLLQWNALAGVQNYQIGKLVGNYITGSSTKSDTAYVINKNSGSVYYTIQPILPDGKPLLRSPAVNIETFGAGCFVSTFVDEAISDEGILLRLELGTRYGVSAISFQHQEGDEFQTIHTIEEPKAIVVRHLHANPAQGLNRYRTRIQLTNGQEIFSDTIQNFFLTKTPFIVFPNPIERSQELNIFSGKFEPVDFEFRLYKTDGTWIRSASLISDREFVSMEGLSPGLYLYRIEGSAGRFSGKIVIK